MEAPLSLELKMNEAVREILLSDRCSSTLLDVTVVKPKELDIFGSVTSNTLRADQVRKLIATMEKQLEERQKLINNLKRDDTIIKVRKHDDAKNKLEKHDSCVSLRQGGFERHKDLVGLGENVKPLLCKIRKSLRNVETKITNMRNINLVISHTTTNESEEVMETSKNYDRFISCPGDHLKNNYIYTAKTEKDNLKSILISKKDGDFEKNKDIIVEDFRKGKSEKDPDISNIAELARKIKILESRLNEQEERAVPRDYFKQIIGKLVSNISRRASRTSKTRSKSDHALSQGSSKDQNHFVFEKTNEQPPIICNPVRVEHINFKGKVLEANGMRVGSTSNIHAKENGKTSKKTAKDEDEEVFYGGANIWRWGEEILKPGIDLKNKIVSLINEIFGKVLEKTATKSEEPVPGPQDDRPIDPAYNTELFQKFFEQINTKVFNVTEKDKETEIEKENERLTVLAVKRKESKEKKVKFPGMDDRDSKKVDVAYVNPKLYMWRDQDSSVDTVGKEEFMRIISKADDLQREILWNNIWSQAKATGQNKQNIITIKVPVQKKHEKSIQMYETNLTLGEVEAVLMKHKRDSPKKYSDVITKLKKQ